MDTTKFKARMRRLDDRYEHLMMTTRLLPFVVVGGWFLTIGTVVKVFFA